MMKKIDIKDFGMLNKIADLYELPKEGAFNIRLNSQSAARQNSKNVEIISKTDKSGIDIKIKSNTKGEKIHIPVVIDESGIEEVVYNDFYIGDNCDIEIVAGCGIHNDGCNTSRHDAVHAFHIGKNSKVSYTEKHYADGENTGKKIMNPETVVNVGENSECIMEMIQIGGLDSTFRNTVATLQDGAKLVITERLMTDNDQRADSDMTINLDGFDSSAQIISRSVGKGNSVQVFKPNAIGNNACKAHIQCDSIIMDKAKISSVPEITANHPDAMLIHEAAIGRINNDQLLKLMTLGIAEEDAQDVIIQGFLK